MKVDPTNIVAVPANSLGNCEDIVITASDGRVYNLGKPTSIFFKLRLAFYKWQRRKELNHG